MWLRVLKMAQSTLKTDERAMITYINGDRDFKAYLLHNGITIGSVIYKNYSPRYASLTSITVNGRMVSIRQADFSKIDWVRI